MRPSRRRTLRINWQREADRWLADPFLSVGVADPKRDLPDDDMVVCNYDILGRLPLRERQWDVIIVDEAHLIKNPDAQRTRETLAIPTPFRLFLTGTPILNRPVELWPLLHACDPFVWDSYGRYVRRYCGARPRKIGRKLTLDVRGVSRPEELQERLRATVMVRRKKRAVLNQTPEKRRQIVLLPSVGAEELLQEEARLWAKIPAEEAARALETGRLPPLEGLSAVRQALGLAKVAPALAFIKDLLESVEKVVVFANHRSVLQGLYEGLPGSVLVHGGLSLKNRQAAVDAFQTDPRVRVFVGQITAAGVGLTLVSAHTVVFVEPDWVSGVMAQAEDRCHRRGQYRNVSIMILTFDRSIDALMLKTVEKKSRVLEKVVG